MLLKLASLALLFTLALPITSFAQSPSKLVADFTTLAGSDANAKSLVAGLRDGKTVTLTDGKTTTTFTPPTGKMGNGSVDNALLLTQAKLKQEGVTNPTPEQLKTALADILQQRADHKGWGEIAKSMGVKLGDLRRDEKAAERRADRREDRKEERADRREDRMERRADRAERPERPERPEKPERGGR